MRTPNNATRPLCLVARVCCGGVRCVRAPRAGAQRRKEREGVRLTSYTRPPDPQRTDRRTGGTRPSGQRREEAPDRHKAQQITQKQDLFESKAQTHDQPRTHSLAGHTRNKPQTNSFTQTNTRPARLNNSRRRHHTPTPTHPPTHPHTHTRTLFFPRHASHKHCKGTSKPKG